METTVQKERKPLSTWLLFTQTGTIAWLAMLVSIYAAPPDSGKKELKKILIPDSRPPKLFTAKKRGK